MINIKGRRFSAREVAEAAEAAAALALAAVAIRLLPFRAVIGLMNIRASSSRGRELEGAAASVRSAVKRASRRVPWRTVCFHEGLAAHWMLRRRGFQSRVHYGLKQGEDRLSAHVWVSLDGQIVVGQEAIDPHVCVAVFPAQ